MEGIFICAATRCFKSFVETSEFLSHLKENHAEDLPPNTEKEGNKLEAISARKSSASDSTVQAPPKPVVYPNSNSHVHDREHEDQHPQSFVETSEFLSHLKENHAEDLPPNTEKEGNKLEAISARKSSASDSTVQAPPKPVVYPNSNSHVHDREHEDQHPQSRDHPSPGSVLNSGSTPLYFGPVPSHTPEQRLDGNQFHVFDRVGPQNQYPQQAFDSQAVLQQDSVPIDPNPVIASSQFGYAPSVLDGTQQFYGTPYDMARPVSTPEVRPEHGSLLGFPPGPAGALNPVQNYPRPWSMGPAADGFMNASDPQGIAFFQGGYGRNMGILPSNPPPPSAINGVEQRQTGNFIDPRDCNRILPPQPLPPPASSHFQQGRPYYGTGSHDAPPGFESGQD